ncbi:hypothetical protein [Streptomyces lavendulae]|uniref:hypothetical protein n=1 Tax=Streptomyces lavendulae TaxID=1914 RepID=UPI0024A56839|nr:hypothetical protein [Streptomyces lavendulae]GLX24449.1 hypothetical protein Slala02_02690 [Streptomyces lavendulae subsp. lavendulae]
MTAWQYFAGAGLVAALCPLHGHVAVAGDGHGRGARVDVCVPGGPPKPPAVRPPVMPPPPVARPGTPSPPPVRVTVPGAVRPTVRHPGDAPGLAERPAPGAAVPGGPAQPPQAPPAADPQPQPEPAPADAPAPPGAAAAVERVSRFHVRPYHSAALARRGPDGLSTMMLMVVVTTPAVLAAAALRPRSKSRS